MDAIILLNKPAGMTSFDAISRCRRVFHEKKAGHTGTLDPNATGLMIVLLGKYTKLVPYCIKDHKHYIAEFKLGIRTDTEDIWGNEVEEKEPKFYSQEELDKVCKKMTGDLMQVPPMYSALKKDGKKLYELARKGIEIEREPRPIHVSSLTVSEIGENLYQMDAVVSSGTYIRTLISDFAKELGEVGTMTSLVRYGIESLSLEDCISLDDLEKASLGKGFTTPDKVIDPIWQRVEIDKYQDVLNGKRIRLNTIYDNVILTHSGSILAAYARENGNVFHCIRGLF